MSKAIRNAAIAFALLLAVAFVLVGCGVQGRDETNSGGKTTGLVKKIIEAFDAREYEEAYELFAEKELDVNQQSSLIDALTERIDKAIADYAIDDLSFENAQEILSAVQTFNLPKLKTKLTTASSELTVLANSKEYYADGLIAFGKLDWIGAIECLSEVIEKDCNYADAVQKGNEAASNMMDDISNQIALKQYDEALLIAEQLHSLRPTDAEVASKIVEINAAKTELELETQRQEALIAAQSSYDQGNYTEAFDTIDSFISTHTGDQEAIDALKQLKDDYVNLIIPKVDEAMQKQEYLRALDMLNNALSVLPDQRLTAKMDELNAVKPTYLCELSCADSKTYEAAKPGETYVGVTGEAYNYAYGNLFILVNECGVDGYANYFINYGYKTFKLTLDVGDESRAGDSFTLRIIGDGVVLKELRISRTFAPTQIELDVSNIGWIEFKTLDHNGSIFGKMYTIIADAYFEK